uniref:Uncharacterized protein n=2 Tax=Physcomitrium patens TaxID=3218 RepID=A0A2K1KEH4_PHYPA|nr:hypothetical protein PHYPA_008552 [Physcomitrium patens]
MLFIGSVWNLANLAGRHWAERLSVYEFQGGEASSDARYATAAPSDSNDLLKNVTGQLATSKNNSDSFPATDLRSNYRMCGTIRDERAGLAVEQRFRDFQPSDLLWIVVQLEVSKHFERSTPPEVSLSPWDNLLRTDSPHVVKRPACRSRNWNEIEKARQGSDRKAENRFGAHEHEQLKQSREDGYHKGRGSAHGQHREKGSGYADHRHLTDRKDRSIIKCRHQSRDGLRIRRRTRRVGARTTQNQPLKSDEGSGICGQDLPASTNGLTRDKLDPTSRTVVRMLNVEKWDCLNKMDLQRQVLVYEVTKLC